MNTFITCPGEALHGELARSAAGNGLLGAVPHSQSHRVRHMGKEKTKENSKTWDRGGSPGYKRGMKASKLFITSPEKILALQLAQLQKRRLRARQWPKKCITSGLEREM